MKKPEILCLLSRHMQEIALHLLFVVKNNEFLKSTKFEVSNKSNRHLYFDQNGKWKFKTLNALLFTYYVDLRFLTTAIELCVKYRLLYVIQKLFDSIIKTIMIKDYNLSYSGDVFDSNILGMLIISDDSFKVNSNFSLLQTIQALDNNGNTILFYGYCVNYKVAFTYINVAK